MEWRDEEVIDHSSGITDLVTSSPSDFQELCNNLTNNYRLQLLSSRDGYRRFTEEETPTLIRQLWKLEDWIIAYCYDDPIDPTFPIDGRLYYRLESDAVSPWVEVETPKRREALTLFRIGEDDTGKGFTLLTTDAGSLIPYDQWVVVDGGVGSNPGNNPVITLDGRTIIVTVDKSKIEADGRYLRTGVIYLQYLFWEAAFPGANFLLTLFTGTLSGDFVKFTGHLTVTDMPTDGIYDANARSDGEGTSLPYINERGHLQGSEWQSHLYQALEPYIKTFTANPADPFGKDPDTWPPDNNRLPLRKIAPIASPVGIDPIVYNLKAFNAQLPKTFIGIDTTESEINSGYSAAVEDFLYQVYPLRFEYKSGAYVGDTTASIEIWAERSWGQVGPVGAMADLLYLQYVVIPNANPFDPTMPYFLIDPNLAAVSEYSGISGVGDWGKLFLVFHQGTPVIESMSYEDTVEAINAAFAEYQTRKAVKAGTTYYAAYRNFGYYIKENPKAKRQEQLDVGGTTFLDGFYASSLPEDVAGNFTYGYAFYLRDSYEGLFEGSPREFIFDGPTTFLQVKTLTAIGDEPTVGYEDAARTMPHSYPVVPKVFGGIAARIIRSTDLYFQSSMEAIFARTLDGGEVYYIDQKTRYWLRTDDLTPPDLPQGLVDAGWYDLTAYVVPHVSTLTDDELQFNEGAYFNGGVLSYDSLPQGPYYFTIINQVGYYSNIVNNIQRVYQSTPGIPHSSPGILFEDFDDENSGITAYQDKPILTTPVKLWRIEGVKSATGAGRTFLRTISDEYGCIANQSMVVTNVGVFLWSATGIVYTDALRAFRVSEHLIGRYQEWLSWIRTGGEIGPEELRGRFDEQNRLIYWSLKDQSGKAFFVCLSLQKGISTAMPITTHDGMQFIQCDDLGVTTLVDYFDNGATLYSDDYQRWYRGQRKFLMVQDPGRTYDESHIDDLKHPIIPFYKSVAFAYGIPWARKQTTRSMWTLRDMTQHGVSMQPLGWNDLGGTPERLRGCLNYQHMPFSLEYATNSLLDLQQFFRHTDAQWKTEMVVSYKRSFGKGRTRNSFKQVGLTALELKYSEIDDSVVGISFIESIDKVGFPQRTIWLEITVLSLISNPVLDLELDESGAFLVSWEPLQDPVPISSVTLTGNTYRIIALPNADPNNSASDYHEPWPTLRFYRRFTDQRIDLIGYNLTFRLIGDRTHGMLKSAEKGGVIA